MANQETDTSSSDETHSEDSWVTDLTRFFAEVEDPKSDDEDKQDDDEESSTPDRVPSRNRSRTPFGFIESRGSSRQFRRIDHFDGRQYIRRRAITGDGDLPYSARIEWDGVAWKFHGEGSLLTSGDNYVAKISVRPIDAVDKAPGFQAARDEFLAHLKIVHVIQDDLWDACRTAEQNMSRIVQAICAGSFAHVQNAEDLLQLAMLVRRHGNIFDGKFLRDVTANGFISAKLKSSMKQYIEKANEVIKRNQMLRFAPIKPDETNGFIERAIHSGFVSHKQHLLDHCSAGMTDGIEELYDGYLLFLTAVDLKLFVDLASIKDQMTLDPVLPLIISKFLTRIRQLRYNHLRNLVPLSNYVYYFLCKNLAESAMEILTVFDEARVVFHGETEWHMRQLPRADRNPQKKCLERQLEILIRLVNHFEPGKDTVKQHYPHEFELLSLVEPVPIDIHCWFCFLDYVVRPLLQPEDDARQFQKLFATYVRFSSKIDVGSEHLESLRVLTNNLVRLIRQVGPPLSDRSELENTILIRQRRFINLAELAGRLTLDTYRDVVGVFGQFWDHSDRFVGKLPSRAKQLHTIVLNIVSTALEQKVQVTAIIRFHKTLIELLVDLGKMPLVWLVRFIDNEDTAVFLRKQLIEPVNNKWRHTEHESYRVLHNDRFEKLYCALHDVPSLPENYVVKVIQTLLEKYVSGLFQDRIWNQNDPKIQLESAILLMDTIRNSLLFYQDLADSTSFEQFYQDSVRPFGSVVEDSESIDDFRKRTLLIKEALLHFRYRSVISVDRALKLFRESNTDYFNETALRHGLDNYLKEYSRLMLAYDGLERSVRIDAIVQDTKLCSERKLSVEWTPEYRQEILPKVLAGVGLVWSILESVDIALTNRYLKPNHIQILCILRMLSADKPNTGIVNHLAQVLTGQGKSVILALTAALFALFGQQVKIVCYSPYLAERDASEYQKLFECFAIDEDIEYETFQGMVEIHVKGISQKFYNYIHQHMGFPRAYATNSEPVDFARTVLLIDEVDVFFSEQFYGETCEPIVSQPLEGLGLVQKKIWELTVQGHSEDVPRQINEFIQQSRDPAMGELRAFINRRQSYTMFDDNLNSQTILCTTNNLQFLTRHLQLMFSSAKTVYHQDTSEFKLDSSGRITKHDDFARYSPNNYGGYDNTFVYFKLKQTGFQESIRGHKNYGYLLIRAGIVSYAKLLEPYRLLLGVTGTLTEMNRYERPAVEHNYLIRAQSVMPSFYGASRLEFSKRDNFRCASTEKVWMHAIFARINEIVQKDRSVLVFFDTVDEISKFTREFATRLDRLQLLTLHTEEPYKEHYISEAGATRMVTLATRQMGRGFDYKTSVTVERNGGVHVIQSFFSLDVKEETQIKGRTARKGYRGSYELIVCLDHIRALQLVNRNAVDATYNELDAMRAVLVDESAAKIARKLQEANDAHRQTKQFYDKI